MPDPPQFVFEGPLLPLLTPDEIYRLADERLLTALCEDRRLEYKSSRIDRRHLGDYFSMWANTKPNGGLIVVGIEKDGTITGCERLSREDLNEIEKADRDFCPDCRPESKRIAVRNSQGQADFILVIRVPYREDKVVRTVAAKAFVRIADEKKELSEDEIRELQIDKRELDFERELATDLAWPNDFDQPLTNAFCGSVREKWSGTCQQV